MCVCVCVEGVCGKHMWVVRACVKYVRCVCVCEAYVCKVILESFVLQKKWSWKFRLHRLLSVKSTTDIFLLELQQGRRLCCVA